MTIPVNTGEMRSTSFLKHDAIRTEGLESCVAVVTYRPGHGGIAHLTNRYVNDQALVTSFRGWLEEERGSVAALIGGWPRDSASLISQARDTLREYGIPVVYEDLDVELHQDVTLRKDGMLQVDRMRRTRTPEGEETHLVSRQLYRLS